MTALLSLSGKFGSTRLFFFGIFADSSDSSNTSARSELSAPSELCAYSSTLALNCSIVTSWSQTNLLFFLKGRLLPPPMGRGTQMLFSVGRRLDNSLKLIRNKCELPAVPTSPLENQMVVVFFPSMAPEVS